MSGGLVLFGALSDGIINTKAIYAAVISGLSVALLHFKNFWDRKA